MNLDDDSLLSAFLDDELDEPGRLAIEAAVLADPRLLDRLRELGRVSDLVGDLSRPPCPRDLAAIVSARAGWHGLGGRRARPHLAAWGAGMGAAAGILVAASLWLLRPQPPDPARPELALAGPQAGRPGELDREAPAAVNKPAVPEAGAAPESARVAGRRGRVVGPDEEEIHDERDRQLMLGMLENPAVRRIFVTTDAMEHTAAKVDDVLRTAPRRKPRYGRITVNTGIMIDPNAPDRATVFILVMDENELDYFRGKLKDDLGLSIEDEAGEAPPSIVTLLSDIGQIDILSGTPAARVRPLANELAMNVPFKSREDGHVVAGPGRPRAGLPPGSPAPATPPGQAAGDGPVEGDRGGPDKADGTSEPRNWGDGADDRDGPGQQGDQPATYMVWVTCRLDRRSEDVR